LEWKFNLAFIIPGTNWFRGVINMKNIGKLLITISLLFNQFVWPIVAFAQIMDTPTPTIAPADTPIPTNSPSDTPTPVSVSPTPALYPSDIPVLTPTDTLEVTVTPTDIPINRPTETPTLTVTPTDTPTPLEIMSVEPVSPTPAATLVVVVSQDQPSSDNPQPSNNPQVNNEAAVNQSGQSDTLTGDNQITTTGLSQSTTVTGQAVALANLVNVVNTTTTGSTVTIYLVNNTNGQVGQIDLNTAWNLLNIGGNNVNVLTIDTTGQNNSVSVSNLGIIQNQLSVTADSGGNQITGGGLNSIYTGNAYALANILNLLNINLLDSRIFLGIINVDGSTLGDLILPNPSDFLTSQAGGAITGSIDNSATINDLATANAFTGGNQISGGDINTISTGNALSTVNVTTIANLNLIGSQQLLIGLNLLGNWTGNIYNWNGPGSVTTGSSNNLFGIGNGTGQSGDGVNANINNAALIQNWILASAMTGNNTINSLGGISNIQTGSAYALANIGNLANLNLFNSRWFYGIINIVGDWKGNAIFAYPDLAITMRASQDNLNYGDEGDININYNNSGYDDSTGSKVEIDLPDNIQYLGDSSGITPVISGNSLIWQLGEVKAKSAGSFVIRTKVFDKQTSYKLVRQVVAAESYMSEVVNGRISGVKTELTTDNNSASVTVNVDGQRLTDNGSELWPKLTISERNNVNNWVNKNDVVTFEISGKNEGEAKVYNSYLVHRILDSKGHILSQNKINIGNVAVSNSGKVTFGIPMNFNLKGNNLLTTESQWTGVTEKGDQVQSNLTQATFLVKFGEKQETGIVQAVGPDPQVLGASTMANIPINFIPYLLTFVVSSYWIISRTRKWIPKQ
jgi:hypothetical protein